NDTNAFNNATLVPNIPVPDSAGHMQSLVVTGLNANTPYYFAIRSRDIWNNWSLVSNSPSGTTWQAPLALVTPAVINRQITPGNVVSDTVSIKNNTAFNSSLDYTVTFANNTFPQGSLTAKIISTGETAPADSKGKQNEKGGTAILGAGGPDAGGYKWKDSDDPNGPVYVWNDITATGTQVTGWTSEGTGTALDDGYAGPINIGFPFKFYGQLKNQLYISTNGHVDFSHQSGTTYSNQNIPSATWPNDVLAAFWDDLDGRTQGTVHYLAEANKFTVQFTNWQKYEYGGNTSSLTFQIVIYKSGKIEYYYKQMSAVLNECSVGIENADGTIATNVAYNAAYLKDLFAIRFAAEPDWLAATNLAGRVMNGATAKVQLTLNGDASYPVGNYQMDMIIRTNDPSHDSVVVPVKMVLTSVPVELTALTAQIKENNVVLNWSTATETNNAGYSIERKDANKAAWTELNFVKGHNTTTEISKYSYSDKNLPYGHYSYRIKQIDFDGKTTYSPIVEADVKAPDQYQLSQNYPNPFNPSTTIKFSLPEKANVKLIVYNNIGQQVAELINSSMEPGYHQVQFDASKLASGMYIYRLVAGKFSDTKKMTIIK
ncbi:MAG: T9SS type A sorting domain-containing protein, partial [Bacteroidota bacterium]|nr:T9SS type A sorting domain-containing protein [Bacteroidota bacterium]